MARWVSPGRLGRCAWGLGQLNPTYGCYDCEIVGWVEERNPTRDLSIGRCGGDRPMARWVSPDRLGRCAWGLGQINPTYNGSTQPTVVRFCIAWGGITAEL